MGLTLPNLDLSGQIACVTSPTSGLCVDAANLLSLMGGSLQFLRSPAGGFVAGQILYVDGGFAAQ